MGEYRIVFDREGCIGALSCKAADPGNWDLATDGKVDFNGATEEDDDIWVKTVGESDIEDLLQAAKDCPVDVIHVYNEEDGEKIYP